ncbi:hypothetical protein [Microbacterium sp. gxy059]|uniref:hypothetical protein n=1 Tax=Microbacterium sp. gxy059 TaxID=2957199 RepID=UPI003D984AA3
MRRTGGWQEVVAFCAFGVVFLALLAPILLGAIPLVSETGVFMLLAGGFAIAGLGLLPAVRRRPSSVRGPNGLSWFFFLAGIALWCAAPIVGQASDAGWSAAVGGGGRKAPMWFLAILTWGTAALMLWAFAVQRIKARRQRKQR